VGGKRVGRSRTPPRSRSNPSKNLGAAGTRLFTTDDRARRLVSALREHGSTKKLYHTSASGRNSRMDEIQAAVLRRKWAAPGPRLDRARRARQRPHDAAFAACRDPHAEVLAARRTSTTSTRSARESATGSWRT